MIDREYDEFIVKRTIAPGISTPPSGFAIPNDAAVFTGQNIFFPKTLYMAAIRAVGGDETLLELLRSKWPEAVREQYPAALKRATDAATQMRNKGDKQNKL